MNIVKKTRIKGRFTQKNLARKCRISQSKVSRIETLHGNPNAYLINNISNALNICALEVWKEYSCSNCKYNNTCKKTILK